MTPHYSYTEPDDPVETAHVFRDGTTFLDIHFDGDGLQYSHVVSDGEGNVVPVPGERESRLELTEKSLPALIRFVEHTGELPEWIL